MIRGGVFAHQLHRGPVFPAVGGIEVEPREIAEFLGQILVLRPRDTAVMVANLRAGAAAAAVAQQGEIRARLEAEFLVLNGEFAELDKMIAAAAGAELCRRLVAKTFRDGADRPVLVHHRMRAAMFEFRADAEARLGLDGANEIGFVAAEMSPAANRAR